MERRYWHCYTLSIWLSNFFSVCPAEASTGFFYSCQEPIDWFIWVFPRDDQIGWKSCLLYSSSISNTNFLAFYGRPPCSNSFNISPLRKMYHSGITCHLGTQIILEHLLCLLLFFALRFSHKWGLKFILCRFMKWCLLS